MSVMIRVQCLVVLQVTTVLLPRNAKDVVSTLLQNSNNVTNRKNGRISRQDALQIQKLQESSQDF